MRIHVAAIVLVACTHDEPRPAAPANTSPTPASLDGGNVDATLTATDDISSDGVVDTYVYDGVGISHRSTGHELPTVSLEQPAAHGDLDKAIIHRYIMRNIQKLWDCYHQELLAQPRIAGRVETHFVIGADGFVTSCTASGVDPNVSSCVAAVIRQIKFAKPRDAGTVDVDLPFTFSRGE